ncbi:TetR/AcrR family transcriptional regulator [Treponema primitia]|uniref:TetR/AcrR family transcriptional regulator n=1 Tax=Treponema primitia TaxID=88058 RepID=UPI00025550AB|nr:TetR/AcrR family transcriptional regulator [Treponema primitia]
MGIFERKGREKAERRNLIMGCAKKLILEYGVEKVSMEDIAKQAELSKGTLYLYFSGKDELFSEICEESAAKFSEYVQSRLEGGISGLEALKRYWLSYLEMYGESEDLFILFNMRHFLAPADSFISLEENAGTASYVFYYLIKKMIEQGIREGTFEQDTESGLVVKTIIALFSQAVENAAKLPRTARKSALIIDELKTVFQIMLRGIAREEIDRSCLVLPDLNTFTNNKD